MASNSTCGFPEGMQLRPRNMLVRRPTVVLFDAGGYGDDTKKRVLVTPTSITSILKRPYHNHIIDSWLRA